MSRTRPSGRTTLSSSPDKENQPVAQPAFPSHGPSPKKKSKSGADVPRGRSLKRRESGLVLGAPAGGPRSASPDTVLSGDAALAAALEELQVAQRCKELTETPLADLTSAYTDDVADTSAPPSTPTSDEDDRE